MRSRRALVLPAVLLLAGTHAAAFLLARGSAAMPGEHVRDSSYTLPAKSEDRADAQAGGVGGSFARRLRELEESKLRRDDFELAREELFRQWIQRDLRGAMDLLYGPEHRERYGSLAEGLQQELAAEITRQPRNVWDWLSTRRFGSGGGPVFGLWCKTLGRAGQTDVLLECLCQPGAPRFVDRDTVILLCGKIPPGATAQLAALRKLIGPLAIIPERECPASAYARRMAQEAGADPVPFLTVEPNEEIRALFLAAWEQRELGGLPLAEQAQRVAALPEAFRAAGADAMVHYTRGDTAFAVSLINAMEAEGLMGDPAGETARDLAKSALGWVMEGEATTSLDSIRTLQGIRSDPLRRFALNDFGPLFSHRATSPIQECVDAIPAGPDRDAFISGVVARGTFPPETRAELLDAIQDPQIAEEARREVEKVLKREEQEASGAEEDSLGVGGE